jgi:hypothetical protein
MAVPSPGTSEQVHTADATAQGQASTARPQPRPCSAAISLLRNCMQSKYVSRKGSCGKAAVVRHIPAQLYVLKRVCGVARSSFDEAAVHRWPCQSAAHVPSTPPEVEREVLALKREEEKLLREIKAAAKAGNTPATRTLAKSLVSHTFRFQHASLMCCWVLVSWASTQKAH